MANYNKLASPESSLAFTAVAVGGVLYYNNVGWLILLPLQVLKRG